MPRSWNTYAYRQALIHNPTEPVKDENGEWFERDIYFYDNPVSYIRETIGEMKRKNMRFTGSLSYKPIESLTLKAMYARRSTTTMDGYYQTKNMFQRLRMERMDMLHVLILIMIVIWLN